MKRVMCVWLPGWPIQRLGQAQPELSQQPLVLYAPASRNILRVTACSSCAAQRGVAPGMPLAEAKALGAKAQEKPLCFELHDPQADRAALRNFAIDCQQFSPSVAVEEADPPDSLL